MRNYVYLFELDSVRKTDTEIIAGQNSLYNEIVVNGNIVVMTMNQIVESRGFFSLLSHQDYQDQLISLFENGAIRISQYGDVRTLAQYLINSVNQEKEFIYSALPVKFSQKRILALIRRSLIYSDLSEIREYYTGMRSSAELVDLFVEVDSANIEKQSSLIPDSCATPETDEEVIEEMNRILESLYELLKTVLKLSTLHDIYVPPRNPDEYKNLKMYNFLRIVIEEFPSDLLEPDSDWEQARKVIMDLPCYKDKNNYRAVYKRQIKQSFEKNKNHNIYKRAFQYAEEIVNFCYNYACEISAFNVSKHYNVSELTRGGEKPTFQADFKFRFKQRWNNAEGAEEDADERYLANETDHFQRFTKLDEIPDFARAVRFTEYLSYKDDFCDAKSGNPQAGNVKSPLMTPRYEDDFENKVQNQKIDVLRSIRGKLGFAIVCILFAGMIEAILDCVWNIVISIMPVPAGMIEAILDCVWNIVISIMPVPVVSILAKFIDLLISLIIPMLISEAVTTLLSKKFPRILSLSDALGSASRSIGDLCQVRRGKSDSSYCNYSPEEYKLEMESNECTTVTCLLSPELKEYCALFNREGKNNTLFRDSNIYPIMDPSQPVNQKDLIRLEEIYQYRFGLVYKSKYNMLLVDPIRKKDCIFPYERICPASDRDGVVIIPVCNGNFILLQQYRHAPRAEQYGFPRGFSESGKEPKNDAIRELQDEIGASGIAQLQLLGRVISDSGLTSGKVYVYYAEIKDYQRETSGHEGIKKIEQVPCDDMNRWISEKNNNGFDDGFTLSAYALYLCWLERRTNERSG